MNRRGLNTILAATVLAIAVASSSRADTVYFLVAEWEGLENNGDSYVLPLSDPAHIEHARELIELGPELAGEAIVVADIAAGADNINRDLLAPGKPAWSWHVTNVQGFFDITAELFDLWPSEVERTLDEYIDDTGGVIGFWTYTVRAELTGPPEDLRPIDAVPIPLPPGVWVSGAGLFGVIVGRALRARHSSTLAPAAAAVT